MYSLPPDHDLDSIASNAQPLHSTDATTPLPTPSQPAPADEDDNTPLLSLLQPRQPFTPHRYALICRSTSSLGLKYDDIPLSRRCTANPYKYRCDWDGSPDIGDGGRTDAECDRKCECRDVSADPKPLCVALGKGGWGVCGV
ncbi:uncharacterized protein HMPREF1541_07865 [Cyphellophora europaea CBS 101466]|uniref:Uncharacterized protein n=1 Tax=Cyphellophora europaea (strain CBS 101466) TaxID=1220924 RepID=W2RMG1_CYPE1|nr:uncharacterized protein HMPREF1541_07865 [Cyphellophora europaea CBS 101466]ETN36878.1 hypothetical protein HMPREF1541_07865 [Cyphellophora europaea CBS 101466]